MIDRIQYLANPCGTSSIPYWKTKQITVPEGMRILHQKEFEVSLLDEYDDETYFRLLHRLEGLSQPKIPLGFVLDSATDAELSAHLNVCYGGSLTSAELAGWRTRAVYCAELWLVLRDQENGLVAASAIAEVDREIGEGALEWIQVSEPCRRRGLGSFLVRELLWRLRSQAQFVTVSGQCGNQTNPEALYRYCGFSGTDVWHVLSRR